MTKNEIKKDLYKSKPTAELLLIDKEEIVYEASLSDGTVVYFKVPLNDIGDAKFYSKMEAHLLIRYLGSNGGAHGKVSTESSTFTNLNQKSI